MNKVYICIDLKSFYASVECVERKLDPITTNLVVADLSRTEKTICLAVTPSLKQYGLSGRSRLYEVIEKVKEINDDRRNKNNGILKGKSHNDIELKNNDELELDFIVVAPHMRKYMKYSTDIYKIYLKYLAPEDIYVYSIDEVFCDVTNYLKMYKLTPNELVTKMIQDVYMTTGITATAGIGTNMYLAKIAMDIVAKHTEPNKEGVRIAFLDEKLYRKELWNHRPLTDFWRVGVGISKRLESAGMYTMGDVAKCSMENEEMLFQMFGINAELLIDHAWGWEPCTMESVKNYKPSTTSLSSGQVLHEPYDYKKTRLIVEEMIELLTLDLVEKHYLTDRIVLTIGYDISNLTDSNIRKLYDGKVVYDHYGRMVPKSAHGTVKLDHFTSSTKTISKELIKLYDKIVNPFLLSRRVTIATCNLINDQTFKRKSIIKQFDLFSDNEEIDSRTRIELEQEEKEKNIQKAIINLKHKYGKNAILRGMNLEEGGTTIKRNNQVGGHQG